MRSRSRRVKNSGVKSLWRTISAPPAASRNAAFAAWSWSSACGSGTSIAGRPMTASSETVDAPARVMTRCAAAMPRREIGEKGRNLGVDPGAGVDRLDARDIFGTRLLHDDDFRAQRVGERRDGRRHDVRHDARALRAAGDEQPEHSIVERRIGRLRRPRAHWDAPDCR